MGITQNEQYAISYADDFYWGLSKRASFVLTFFFHFFLSYNAKTRIDSRPSSSLLVGLLDPARGICKCQYASLCMILWYIFVCVPICEAYLGSNEQVARILLFVHLFECITFSISSARCRSVIFNYFATLPVCWAHRWYADVLWEFQKYHLLVGLLGDVRNPSSVVCLANCQKTC